MVFTTRLAGGRGGRNGFETELRPPRRSSRRTPDPTTPTTCGKVERFQQTLKTWLRAQPTSRPPSPSSNPLDRFVAIYNHHRPHRSLPQRATPAVAYTARPKATPGDRRTDTHYRVRHDRVDKTGRVTLRHNGRLHHIGLGHEHARTPVVMLIADLDVRVINAATGELLRHLTLDPNRDYQPLGRPPGPHPENETTRTQ